MNFAAAILVSAARQKRHGHESAALRIARRHLLRLPFDVAGEMPDMDAVRGFARILTPEVDFSALWDAIRGVRTFQEEVRLFRQAGPGPLKATSFPALSDPSRMGAIGCAHPCDPGENHLPGSIYRRVSVPPPPRPSRR